MSSVDSMKYLLLASLSALALMGCASTPAPADATAAANNDGVICEREMPTGSMMTKSKCRSAEQREADRAAVTATQEAIRNQRTKPPGQ